MKIVKRMALGALSAATSVLIACAYGMSYSWGGYVRDSDTSDPIPGIRVDCEKDTQQVATATTNANGYYEFGEGVECDQLLFTDVDGADNGSYDATQITLVDGGSTDVEMEPSDS
jgi:hypothetical protein